MATLDELVVKLAFDATGLQQGAKEAVAATEQASKQMADAAEKGEKSQTASIDGIVEALKFLAVVTGKTASQTVKANQEVERSNKATTQSIEGLIRSAAGFFLLLAGAKSLKTFTLDMIGLDAAVGRVAHSTGSTTEAISAIGRAAERVGGTFDGAVGGVRGFVDSFQQLRTTGQSGILEPLAKLQALGGKPITLGKNWHESLLQIADDLQALDRKDPALADYLGRQILGDEGLVNVAKGGRAGVLREEASAPKITKEQAAAAQELQRNLAGIRQDFQGIGNAILMDFGPAMVSGLKWVKDLIDANRELIETKVKEWVKDVADWFRDHQEDIKAFGTGMTALVTAAGTIAGAFVKQSPMMMALEAFAFLMGGRVLGAVSKVLAVMKALGSMPVPAGLAAALGLVGANYLANNTMSNVDPWADQSAGETAMRAADPGLADRVYGKRGEQLPHGPRHGVGTHAQPHDTRNLWQRTMPKWAGGKDAPGVSTFSTDMTPESRALLDTLASGEAKDYNVLNGSGTFSDYSHHPGGRAAGRYQFLPSTWGEAQGATGVKDFGPASQDKGAWWLAQRDYKKRTGRDLSADLKSNEPGRIAAIGQALHPTWVSTNGQFADRYGKALARQPAPVSNAAPIAGEGDPDKMIAGDLSGRANLRVGDVTSTKGFIVHHTAGRGSPEGVVSTLNQRGLGVQYVMDRDGKIYRTLPSGAKGYHVKPSEINDLNNSNTQGMEVIAKDDSDVTPAQIASGKAFLDAMTKKYPGLQVFGHGEINHQKQPMEGHSIVEAFRHGGAAPATDPNYKAPPTPMAQRTLQGYMGRDTPPPGHSEATPTFNHTMRHVLKVLADSRRLTAHNDNHPVSVEMTDKSAMRVGERTFGKFVDWGKRHPDQLDHARSIAHGQAAALGRMTRVASSESYASHSTHNVDRRVTSDTKINGGIHIHTAATDAHGIAADIEPHLHRGQAAGRADYGLA